MDLPQEGVVNHHDSSELANTTSHGPEEPLSPTSPVEDATKRAMDHDSLVTVRLSEPPTLHVDTVVSTDPLPSRKSLFGNEYTPTNAMAEVVKEEEDLDEAGESDKPEESAQETPNSEHGRSLQDELEANDGDDEAGDVEVQDSPQTPIDLRQSVESEDVNWDKLQQTEDEESKDQDSDNNTALLLARLEQENNRLATNPKSVKVQVVEKVQSPQRRPRPPSMAQLRQMVHGPTPSALRYSMLPPPPMTDLEFYMALVKDYQQTAARLPTLLSNKIRKGIPPPLRGVVWQSMSQSRDSALEDMFDRLSGESSPYEGIIGKDLGRSFPGVEMFMDPEGDGQKMLGRVLKCFSLYDTKIGYCQGLAFLVGPLLMHMPDKQAFCVLVKLMEDYDLRHCFVPDLSGLHVRIYQFRELLRQHLPNLSAHLDDLQVDPAYVSQWFLSFFAVTCPLPMLFRIYDVIFAEGASETIMRVALSLMRKNQGRILACTEMDDVMQLLLSRGLWDCYHYNADEFVQDFVNLSDAVSRARLAALEQGYREAQIGSSTNQRGTDTDAIDGAGPAAVATAASRFLGRLWAASGTPKFATFAQSTSGATSPSNTSSTLSPGLTAASRPLSMLRRSASKQSLASTLNSMEAASSTTSSSGSSVLSSASTEATSLSRDSSTAEDSSPDGYGGPNKKDAAVAAAARTTQASKDDSKYLHSQIEDLLTALSELQRSHSLLANQLQKEREERDEDRKAVRSLLDGLRWKAGSETVTPSDVTNATNDAVASPSEAEQERPTAEQLSSLLDVVESRFSDAATSRRSSIPQTKSQLRDELARAKEQLANELAKTKDSNRRIYDMEQEVTLIKDQLRESHAHVRNLHTEKQRLEKQIHTMRVRASDASSSGQEGGDWFSRTTGIGAPTSVPAPNGGLRELKLGRSRSTPTQALPPTTNKRASSLLIQSTFNRESVIGSGPATAPVSEQDALLLELAQAKTSEAIARQEAEENKQKLESLRKAFGLGPGDAPPSTAATSSTTSAGSAAGTAASAAMGMFGRLTGSPAASEVSSSPPRAPPPQAATPAAASGGGFWGWRR